MASSPPACVLSVVPGRRLCSIFLVSALLSGTGCTEIECAGLAETEPVVELGVGQDSFSSLDEGEQVEIVLGPQGGYHIWGALQTEGLHGGRPPQPGNDTRPFVDFEVEVEDTFLSVYTQGPRLLERRPGGRGLEGALVVLDIRSSLDLHEAEADMSVVVEDICGRQSTDERRVMLVSPLG